MSAAKSSGVETNTTILADGRGILQKVLESNLRIENLLLQSEKDAERRHNDIATLLIGISRLKTEPAQPTVNGQANSVAVSSPGRVKKADEHFYFLSKRLASSTVLFVYILM